MYVTAFTKTFLLRIVRDLSKIPFKLRIYRCTEQLTLLSAKESYIFIRQISGDTLFKKKYHLLVYCVNGEIKTNGDFQLKDVPWLKAN